MQIFNEKKNVFTLKLINYYKINKNVTVFHF